ncbi:MAG: glucosyltransferase domain-containing protein [Lachnospiraceae bacterium]|nr:glucosyltransferase domain-containing protein [Lachnospiraceae bacterium]
MERLDDILKKIYDKISGRFRLAFISAMASGIVAHMYMFMNKLPNHDDLGINNFGSTFRNGRWFLWVVGSVAYHLDLVFSLPWVNGLVTLLLLGICAGLVAELIGMKSRIANVILGAALVVFPSWTGTFFFMFTAPYYALAVLMSVISVRLMVRKSKATWLSPILFACALGIYQSYLPFTATLYVVLLFLMLFDERYGYLDILKQSLLYLFNLTIGVLMYFGCMKLSLFLTGQELSAYKGISSMGRLDFSRIPQICRMIGVNFFGIFLNNNLELSYNYITKGMYLILMAACAVLIVGLLLSLLKRRDILKAIETVVLTGAFVVAINLIYIMCEDGFYSLMYYSYVFLIIFPFALLDRRMEQVERKSVIAGEYIMTLAAVLGILSYCHFANGQYFSMQLSFDQALSYYTTMITEIKSTKGYNEDMKVVFGGVDIVDKTLYHNEIMSVFSMSGRDDALADAHSKQLFILYYCGFDAEIAGTDILSEESRLILEAMPTYPNDGSIRILDDTVVVKLSEQEDAEE